MNTWVLTLFIIYNSGPDGGLGTSTAEFDTKEACYNVLVKVQEKYSIRSSKSNIGSSGVCVRKGDF